MANRHPDHKQRCVLLACTRGVSSGGSGRLSHLRAHVRAGELVEIGSSQGPRFVDASDLLGVAVARMDERLHRAASNVHRRERLAR